MNCYYKILGVSVRASHEEIRRAFRMLAMRWHPDRNPQDPHAAERFREVLKAYETLIDVSKRGNYDKAHGHRARCTGKDSRWRERRTGRRRFEDYNEALRDFFGVKTQQSVGGAACDIRFDLQVLRSALSSGINEEIDYTRRVFCGKCVERGRNGFSGFCEACGGEGELEETCSIRIWVPAGAVSGSRFRFAGAGDRIDPNNAPGDLVVLLHVVEGA